MKPLEKAIDSYRDSAARCEKINRPVLAALYRNAAFAAQVELAALLMLRPELRAPGKMSPGKGAGAQS
jgi:hypothetical protein